MPEYIIEEDKIKYNVSEYSDGDKFWRLNGVYHRENGPAIECSNGYQCWYKQHYIHRIDGPAVIRPDGRKEYYLNGKYYPNIESDEEWLLFQIIT